ncbi:hypothetical protein VTI74DRAFT_7237 [Chaetomium olivicolor]
MQAESSSNLAHSPDLGAESSFPERHFTPYADDKPLFSGIEPGPHSAAANRPLFEASAQTLPSQSWPSQDQSFVHRGYVPFHDPELSSNKPSTVSFPQTTPSIAPEWPLFHERCRGGILWQPAPPDFTVEDESDSNQSRNESIEEASLRLPSWPITEPPGRRSSHKIPQPTGTSVSTTTVHHATSHPTRPYIPDFDYGTEWVDSSNTAAAFSTHLNNNHADQGPHIDVTFQNRPSAAKVDSKRIAHKLSEKTRRNRLTIAIREIQKLLPAEAGGEETSSRQEADFVVRPGVPSSKLDVVEMAVGFIKDLKEKNKEMARRLQETERKLERCQCQCQCGGKMSAMESASGPLTTDDGKG